MGVHSGVKTGANPGGAIEMIAPPKTYELTVFTMIVYNSKTAFAFSPYKAILSSIALSQKCWEVYFISLEVVTRIEALLTNITEISP